MKKNKTNIDRRRFLKSGGAVLPALAVLGMALSVSEPARADCFGGTCRASCADTCTESCKGDCMGSCKNEEK